MRTQQGPAPRSEGQRCISAPGEGGQAPSLPWKTAFGTFRSGAPCFEGGGGMHFVHAEHNSPTPGEGSVVLRDYSILVDKICLVLPDVQLIGSQSIKSTLS